MTVTLIDEHALRAIEHAARPEDLFGVLDPHDPYADLKKKFHLQARFVHPDLHGGNTRAQEAFKKLGNFHAEAEQRIKNKLYGKGAPTPPRGATVVEHGSRKYVVGDLIANGDIADVFHAAFYDAAKDKDVKCALKISRNMSDNDLLESEAASLKATLPTPTSDGKGIRYVSRLYDSFKLPDKTLGPRQVNILKYIADAYTLEEVHVAYPNGIVFEDAVWMFNRMTEGLGYAHRAGRIHGAVIPPHFMIRPTDHGGKLIDWSYAVPPKDRVKALASPWKKFYAPEILAKGQATPSTDVYMAAKCIAYLLGMEPDSKHIPTPKSDEPNNARASSSFVTFLKTCMEERPGVRVNDAWQVRKSLDDMLTSLNVQKRFHKFQMPARTA